MVYIYMCVCTNMNMIVKRHMDTWFLNQRTERSPQCLCYSVMTFEIDLNGGVNRLLFLHTVSLGRLMVCQCGQKKSLPAGYVWLMITTQPWGSQSKRFVFAMFGHWWAGLLPPLSHSTDEPSEASGTNSELLLTDVFQHLEQWWTEPQWGHALHRIAVFLAIVIAVSLSGLCYDYCCCCVVVVVAFVAVEGGLHDVADIAGCCFSNESSLISRTSLLQKWNHKEDTDAGQCQLWQNING